MKEQVKTRREFLKQSASAAAATALYLSLGDRIFGAIEKKTRVVLVRHEGAIDDLNKPNADVVQKMLDDAVTALFDISDPVEAWKKIIKPTDTVGIKTNVWRYLPTTSAVENALKKRVMDAGVSEDAIGIRDRGVLYDPVFKKATALINARPMRTHYWSGVGTLLKNYIMFSDNPPSYHPDTCADLAKLWFLPNVKGKTRLNVLVMFTPLFHGSGPHHFNPQYIWAYKGLIVGTDPVAVDSVGVRILQSKRKLFFKEDRPLNPSPKHVFLADTRHHLGTADPEKIDLQILGWKKDLLI
ncbi:DUF362 domain-containing protein [candidate division KSB1 bacterium]|nr:DUF362 domain-containing protein [candidate division KSB1 bacterium]